MINLDEWAEIRRLHFAEGLGIKAIAGRLGVARNTVRSAVRSSDPPCYVRVRRSSAVDPFELDVRRLLGEFPEMPATVIAERIGWERSMTILKDRVRELRPLFKVPDHCQRTHYEPGELAQFDLWQPEVEIPLGFDQVDKLWVVTSVSGFSRFDAGWMVPRHAGWPRTARGRASNPAAAATSPPYRSTAR